MGAYGSPELHPKILEQNQEEARKKSQTAKQKSTFVCPHCGKDIYLEKKMTPLRIVQYSLASLFATIAVCLIVLMIYSLVQTIQ